MKPKTESDELFELDFFYYRLLESSMARLLIRPRLWAGFFLILVFTGCNSKANTDVIAVESSEGISTDSIVFEPLPKDWTPTPRFDLKQPSISAFVNGEDVSKLAPRVLESLARKALFDEEFEKSSVYNYWLAKTQPERLYELASCKALAGDVEGAFFWLQKAGLDIGISVRQTREDDDFERLHNDPRWKELLKWLYWCEVYHRRNATLLTTIILPSGYDIQKDPPLNVVLCLPGNKSSPNELVDPNNPNPELVALSNSLKIAFVGVSGSKIRSKYQFDWAENSSKDLDRVNSALEELKQKARINRDRIILLGCLEGATIAFHLAARNPDKFAGSIGLSAFMTRQQSNLIDASNPLLKKRGFVFGRSDEISVRGDDDGVRWARKNGLKVLSVKYSEIDPHALPTKFEMRFGEWYKYIVQLNEGE